MGFSENPTSYGNSNCLRKPIALSGPKKDLSPLSGTAIVWTQRKLGPFSLGPPLDPRKGVWLRLFQRGL